MSPEEWAAYRERAEARISRLRELEARRRAMIEAERAEAEKPRKRGLFRRG